MTSQTTKYFVWLTLTSKATSVVLCLDYMRPVIVCQHVCSLISFFIIIIIPLASTMHVKSGKEATAAAISESGNSIFHPSHSDSLVPRRQSAPLDSCKFHQDDGTPAADKEHLIWRDGSRAKELKYRKNHRPLIGQDGSTQRRTTIATLAPWRGRGQRRNTATFTDHKYTRTVDSTAGQYVVESCLRILLTFLR